MTSSFRFNIYSMKPSSKVFRLGDPKGPKVLGSHVPIWSHLQYVSGGLNDSETGIASGGV